MVSAADRAHGCLERAPAAWDWQAAYRACVVVADAQYKLSGCAAVIVDAKPSAVEFYRQFGFKDLLVLKSDPAPTETSPIRMFIPIATVHAAIAEAAREEPAAPVTSTMLPG